MQQHVVEHEEHDKAQQKSWSSTASGLLPHYNPIHGACHLNHIHTATGSTHTQATQKALWRRASGEAAGEEILEALVAYLHTGGLVLYGRFPQE